MNVSYKWLKEYVDFDLTPQETADALTSCGLEVDALEEVQLFPIILNFLRCLLKIF